MDRIMLLCAMLTVSFSVMSEPQTWMKKDDPNTLGLFVTATDCPFDRKELQDMAEGEYLRARIKPTDDINGLNITINALCMKSINSNGQHVGTSTAYTIDFSRRFFIDETYVNYVPGKIILLNSGSNKREAKTNILDSIREALNGSITDYLKANME